MAQTSTKAVGGPPLDEAGLCLLSLDGGGVRGLSTLLILKRLMERTNTERKSLGLDSVKPWQLFDLIGGTSTGGLIAIMLGRLKMDVSECIEVYTSLFERIFKTQKHKYPVNLWGNFGSLQNRFDSDILRDSIKEIVKRQGLSEAEYLNAEGDRACRVFVCATAVENATPVLLRDYDLVDEANDDSATIVEAALATSAATTFFEPVTIGVRRYVVGALGRNNPIEFVWQEAQNIWCPDDGRLDPMVKCLVSIGTGNPGSTSVGEGAKDFFKTLKDIATESEITAARSLSQHRGLLELQRYFRYNVEQGLQGVGLEEYRKQATIETATRTYLANEMQKGSLRRCAKNLVLKQLPTPMKPNHLLIADAEKPVAVPTYFLVPPPSFQELTGRKELMLGLEELMADFYTHTRVVLYGLGDIGKTRIALEYAYKWKKSNTASVFWVHAGTAERIEKDYLDIAKAVGIPGWEDPKFDKLGMVKDWFERKALGKWILIIDNADDIDMLYGGPANSIRYADYFPRASSGAILLTTRNMKVGTRFTSSVQNLIHVQPLPVAESIRLLKAKIIANVNEEDYASLAIALDNVPLALVQAAAFITEQSSSISEYLHLYNQSDTTKIQLLSDDFEDDIRDKDTKRPVVITFFISFEQIKKSDPYAAEILSFMSMLDPQAIPRSLLINDESPVICRKALGTLQAFSLITRSSRQDQDDELYDLHRLVRLAMYSWLIRNGELAVSKRKAVLIMTERFNVLGGNFHENRETCRIYFPHALAILSSIPMKDDSVSSQAIRSSITTQSEMQVEQSDLFYTVSKYLRYRGDYRAGQPMMQRSLAIREEVLGQEHAKTLRSMCEMIWYLNTQGNAKEALKVGRKTLLLQEKTLGQQHPHTLETIYHLTNSLKRLEKYEEAELMTQKSLQFHEEIFGEEDLRTADIRSNLGNILSKLGNYEEAEQMARQTLQHYKNVLGVDHPKTLKSMSDLATCLEDQSKHEEAEQIYQQALELRKKVLGNEHPDTLKSMSHLATVLNYRCKYEEAEEIDRQTLQFKKKVLGDEHPDTLLSMSNLACYLDNQNKHKEAEEMTRQTLQFQKNVLGDEHRDTLINMSNLASNLNNQNKYEEAEKVARQTLQLRKKVLGDEHPHTLINMSNLAYYLNNQNKHEEAEEMAQQTLQFRKKVLSKKHPDTILSTEILIWVLNKQGKHREARMLKLQLQDKVSDDKHPHEFRARSPRSSDPRRGVLSWFSRVKGKGREF